jgi:hypothetical protein
MATYTIRTDFRKGCAVSMIISEKVGQVLVLALMLEGEWAIDPPSK